MVQSLSLVAPYLLALVACVPLGWGVLGHPGEPQSDEITLEHMKIFVKYQNGATFSLMVEPDDTMEDLLDHIQDYVGLPDWTTQLWLGDKRMKRFSKLSDYNINSGTTVTLVTSEQYKTPKTIDIRTREGRMVEVTTLLSNTVASLKDNITQLTGITQVKQRLLLGNKELKDDRRLMDYPIMNNHGMLELGKPLEDCRQKVTILVKTISGAMIKIEANMADTVDDLKQKINNITVVPADVQRLFDKNHHLISGEDRLCDLKLERGPTVHMYLYSSRIKSLDQVARLRAIKPETQSISPDKGPIFREVEDDATTEDRASPRDSLYKDARNWIPCKGGRPTWCSDIFDPIAYLVSNHDLQQIDYIQKQLESKSHPDANEGISDHAMFLRARIKLITAVMPYRDAGDLKWFKQSGHLQGITLGGGILDVSPEQLVPLGADVNNWAPDGFSDLDLMRLFQVAERVRQVLARSVERVQGILTIARQRQINQDILYSYIVALVGYPPSIEFNQEIEGEECGFCRDDLTAEPAIRLPCQHAFHADCMIPWLRGFYNLPKTMESFESLCTRCAHCRRGFMFPYEGLGKAELETPELQ